MPKRVTDLTFLRNFSDGNQVLYEKYIRLFLTDTVSLMNTLHKSINEDDWKACETISHTLRARFNFMGIKEGEDMLKSIKENASAEKNIADAKENIEAVSCLFKSAVKELEEELNFLKNSGIGF